MTFFAPLLDPLFNPSYRPLFLSSSILLPSHPRLIDPTLSKPVVIPTIADPLLQLSRPILAL